jgi:hypothetical protein
VEPIQGQRAGEKVLEAATQAASTLWGPRLVASYALGSLVHGGFSAEVSDIDLVLVLEGPLEAEDTARVNRIFDRIKAEHALGDRLSIMWGTTNPADDEAKGFGRLPAVDRSDLIEHGKLLAGTDVRDRFAMPTSDELIKDAAQFVLSRLDNPDVLGALRSPTVMSRSSRKRVTKLALFPARFLFTAHAGKMGRNAESARYVESLGLGPASTLAARALAWRDEELPDEQTLYALVAAGLHPLYEHFENEYRTRLLAMGETGLADGLSAWFTKLEPTTVHAPTAS